MASEKSIEQVLNLLTTAPKAEIESLHISAKSHAKNMQNIIGNNNIVAIGISEKISNDEPVGKLALTLYVEKKLPLEKLSGDKVIPPTVPESISGNQAIPTDVVEIGKLTLEQDPLVTRNPLQPGYSIGHFEITAGTFGAVVSKGSELFILSNSHVLAKSGTGKKGDAILYPGNADGGKNPDDLIAHLEDFAPFLKGGDFVNHVDCAIAKPTKAGLTIITSEIKGLGIPKGIIKAQRGMKITKVGRTTGKTTGVVNDVHFRTKITYDDGVGDIGFTDQVFCTRYSDGGDSGSLILDASTGRAVGLHFAGAKGGSVFNPIDEVLSALKVQLVTSSIGKNQVKNETTKKFVKKTSAAPKKIAPTKKPEQSKKVSKKKN